MPSKTLVDVEWISGAEARRLLDWQNTASVRDAAKQRGAFRWRKRGNGRIEYLRRDVEEYRTRHREQAG